MPLLQRCSTASIVYETFLFGLMMVGVTKSGKDNFGDATLMNVLVRDGTLAYVGIFSTPLFRCRQLSCLNLIALDLQWSCC